MAEPVETTEGAGPVRSQHRINPVLLVVGAAVIVFFVAFLVFRGGGKKATTVTSGGQVNSPSTASGTSCAVGQADPTYTVTLASEPNPPRAEGTTFHLTVRHNGTPVTGAKVCVTADMTEMHHAGIMDTGKETSNGTYDATLKFGMRGPYEAMVVINEPGKSPVVSVVKFQVN